MEVVYFVISFIEIILTISLVFALRNWNGKILNINDEITKNTPSLNKNIKNASKVLNITSKISIIYKKFEILNNGLSKIKSAVSVINFLQGKKSNKRFSLIPFLRKILFFI